MHALGDRSHGLVGNWCGGSGRIELNGEQGDVGTRRVVSSAYTIWAVNILDLAMATWWSETIFFFS